jgi:outer membrane cobalamin receptor
MNTDKSAINYGVAAILWLLTTPAMAWQGQTELSEEEALLGLYGDLDMISIATGSMQSIAKAPAVASVIYAQDIEMMGATDLDQILETIPGLHVARNSLGYNPIYVFRGIHSNYNPQVLMLINGIPISNLFHGDRGLIWGGMPVQAIARIEIIRGPGSALYGADAFAGMINIITLSGTEIDKNQVGMTLGSYNSKSLWGKFATNWQGIALGMVIEYHKTDGQDGIIASDLQTGLDFFTGTQVSNAPGSVSLSRDNLDLRLDIEKNLWQFRAGLQQRKDWGNGVGVAEALDPDNRWQSSRYNADLTYHNNKFSENWDVQAQLSYFATSVETENNMRIFPAGSDLTLIGFGGVYPDGLIGNPDSFERHSRANFTANYTGIEEHHIRSGLGYSLNEVYKVKESKNFGINPSTGDWLAPGSPIVDVSDTPYVYLTEGDRKNSYVFIQDIWNVANDWELTAGIRRDHYTDFGTTTNPRLALVWSTTRKLTTKLLYGKAFRAPSFAETNAINNPIVLGNPELTPERLASYELAFHYQQNKRLTYNINLFHYDWSDIIKFTTDGQSNSKSAKNIGLQQGQGVELEANWQINPQWKINANYAWQDSQDKLNNSNTSQIPKQQLYLAADWKIIDNLSLHSQLNWVLTRVREPLDTRPDIKDYALVDLSLHYHQQHNNWGADLMLRNVTDTDAREPSAWSNPAAAIANDLPLAGRTIYGQVYWQF